MGEPGLQALGVLGGGAGAGAERRAQHHRDVGRAAEHEVDLRGLVDDLVHRLAGEVGELDLHDRPHAGQGGADGSADDAELGDRGVADALLAEAVVEVAGDAECAAVDADVLAEHEHPLVGGHRLADGLADRLGVGDRPVGRGGGLAVIRWCVIGQAVAKTRRGCRRGGVGRALAARTASRMSWVASARIALTALSSRSAALDDDALEAEDRVVLAPLGDLLVGAVEVLVALAVALPAVGLGLEQGRALAGAGAGDGLGRRLRATASTSLPSTVTPGMP